MADGGLAGLAVTDDEFTLATTDRGHGVDRLDAGLERLVHGLAAEDARCLDLHTALDGTGDLAGTVDGFAECVDDTAEHRVADGHRQDAAGRLDGLAFFDLVDVAQDDGADRVFVEVEGEAHRAVLELQEFVHGGVGQPRDACDAVADLGDTAHGAGLDRRFEAVEVLLECRCDISSGDGEFSHSGFP